MVFFDTNIWIELCGVKTPTKPNEIRQATLASALLQRIMNSDEIIVTCNEQLLEIISAVQKIKMTECSKNYKASGKRGIGNIKEFRKTPEYASAKQLCNTVVADVKHFAEMRDCEYSVDDILKRIDVADINDCIYYDYCKQNSIDFYTFDHDVIALGATGRVHVIA